MRDKTCFVVYRAAVASADVGQPCVQPHPRDTTPRTKKQDDEYDDVLGKQDLELEALRLSHWIDSHIAMQRSTADEVKLAKLSRELKHEHENLWLYLPSSYVERYIAARSGKVKSNVYCLTQTPGTCVMFSLLNVMRIFRKPLTYKMHQLGHILCDIFDPFNKEPLYPIVLNAEQNSEIGGTTVRAYVGEDADKMSKKLKGQFDRRLQDLTSEFQHRYHRVRKLTDLENNPDASSHPLPATPTPSVGSPELSFQTPEARVSRNSPKDLTDFDDLNLMQTASIMFLNNVDLEFCSHIQYPKSKYVLHGERRCTILGDEFQTILEWVKTRADKGVWGVLLVQADVKSPKRGGRTALVQARKQLLLNKEREGRTHADNGEEFEGTDSADDRHAIAYIREGKMLRWYDSWRGSSWTTNTNSIVDSAWKGINHPNTHVIFSWVVCKSLE